MGYYKVQNEEIKKVFEDYFSKVVTRNNEIRKFMIDAGAEKAYFNDRYFYACIFPEEPSDLLWKRSKLYKDAWVPTHKTSIGRDLAIMMGEVGVEVSKTDWVKVFHYGEPTKGCYFRNSTISFNPGVTQTKSGDILLSTSEWVDPLWDRSKLPSGAIKEITSEEYRQLSGTVEVL
jgi:hypothetical protein